MKNAAATAPPAPVGVHTPEDIRFIGAGDQPPDVPLYTMRGLEEGTEISPGSYRVLAMSVHRDQSRARGCSPLNLSCRLVEPPFAPLYTRSGCSLGVSVATTNSDLAVSDHHTIPRIGWSHQRGGQHHQLTDLATPCPYQDGQPWSRTARKEHVGSRI